MLDNRVPCAEKYLYFVQSPIYTFVVGLLLFCQHVKDFFFSWVVAYVFRLIIDTTVRATFTVFTPTYFPLSPLLPSSLPFPTKYSANLRTHIHILTYLLCILILVEEKYLFLYFVREIRVFLLQSKKYSVCSKKFIKVILHMIYSFEIFFGCFLNFISTHFDNEKKNGRNILVTRCNCSSFYYRF